MTVEAGGSASASRPMSLSRRHHVCLLVILLAAVAIRFLAAFWWEHRLPPETPFYFGDSESYWVLGQRIAAGEPYVYGENGPIFRTPGYPALLAMLFAIFGGETPVLCGRLLGAVIGAGAVAAVYGLGRVLFGQRAGLGAAAIAAVYPGAIATSVFILSEAPFALLMLLQLHFTTLSWRAENRRGSLGWAAAAGLLAGLATLVRPSWLLFTPLFLLSGVALLTPRRRQGAAAVVSLAVFAAVLTPWWIRNYQLAGRFVPTTLQVGASLYDGLSPAADGSSDMRFVEEFRRQQQRADLASPAPPQGLFQDRLDRRMRTAALDWARTNPDRAAELALIKFARTWNIWPNEPGFRSGPLRAVVALSYGPVLLLSVWGAWRLRRKRGRAVLLCLAPALYVAVLHVIFVGSIRYRQPAMLALIPLAAASLAKDDRREPTQ